MVSTRTILTGNFILSYQFFEGNLVFYLKISMVRLPDWNNDTVSYTDSLSR